MSETLASLAEGLAELTEKDIVRGRDEALPDELQELTVLHAGSFTVLTEKGYRKKNIVKGVKLTLTRWYQGKRAGVIVVFKPSVWTATEIQEIEIPLADLKSKLEEADILIDWLFAAVPTPVADNELSEITYDNVLYGTFS